MTRVKFLVFALVALCLWLANLTFLAPALSARAVEQATKQAAAAPGAVAARLDSRVGELRRAILKVAGSAAALAAVRSEAVAEKGKVPPAGQQKVEPPSPEKLAVLKAAVLDAAPEGLKATLVVGLANEAGTLWVRGGDAPSATSDVLDLAKLTSAGADGADVAAFGTSYLFFSVPVVVPDKAEVKVLGSVVVGAPALPEGVADDVATDLRLASVAITRDGKQVQAGGADKANAGKVDKAVKVGSTAVMARGSLDSAGPFTLPMATSGDTFGGNAPLSVGLNQALADSPYSVAVSASLAPVMQTLADYQKSAVLALMGLLFLAAAFTLIIGGAPEGAKASEFKVQPAFMSPVTRAKDFGAGAPLKMADLPPAPEAHPDDFHFGPASGKGAAQAMPPPPPPISSPTVPIPAAAAKPTGVTASIPAASLPDEFDAAFAPAPETKPKPAVAESKAKAAPAPAPAPAAPPHEFEAPADFNPDATRVATIPQELLQASLRPTKDLPAIPMPAPSRVAVPMPRVPSVASASSVVNTEEQHFQEVYREFVTTRERCGEPADGLTYDKFLVKLKKSRDQLVAKHACRTVRFQVYVKDGKASLKATPIKE